MSDSKIYVISDTHFQHHNILKYEPSRQSPGRVQFKDIYEHDKFLVEQWNSVVRNRDTVWHLGDVCFGPRDSEHLKDVLSSLKGYKRLVLGNHDAGREDLLRQYFEKIYGVAEYGSCVLSHIPIHPYQLEKRYRKNIHGHMHTKRLDDPRYECVSVEQTNFKPVLLARLVQ